MTLTSGTRFGPYEILEPIGAGGMGEVYRARDTKLGREVAIKVLPEELSQHAERLQRFEREAKLLAALNHSNIATLYGVEESGGRELLVMELVEGETLAERIARGPIPVAEAIPLFVQMAEGLESAHEKGIIHRDLKPVNVKITPDGQVKILDFGLAKAFLSDEVVAADTSQSPTLTRGTAAGVIMGTASYMSPEQAKGKTVDRRTDIWAFGCVLFEALTGRKAFRGDDVSEILASVLRDEPDFRAVPPGFSKLLARCLDRDVRRRFQHIGDMRVELEEVTSSSPGAAAPRSSSTIPLAAALVVALALAGWGWLRNANDVPRSVIRSTIDLEYPLAFETNRSAIAISRDGRRMLAIVDVDGTTQVYVRDLSQTSGRLVPGTEGVHEAFFSPDGESVGFVGVDSYLYTLSLSGGAPVRGVLTSPVTRGATWVRDDTIVLNVSMNDGLDSISPAGRSGVTAVDTAGSERSHRWPQTIPGRSDTVLYTVSTTGSIDEYRIAALSLETGEIRTVLEGGYSARATACGHLVFGRGGDLLAVPIELDTLEGMGAPITVLENVSTRTNGAPDYDVSDTGTLIYVEGDLWNASGPVGWVDAQGRFEIIMQRDGPILDVSLSPDGDRLAMTFGYVGDSEVYSHDIARGTSTRLTFDPGEDFNPIWSPDGEWLAFASEISGGSPPKLHRMRADGSGTPEILFEPDTHAGQADVPTSWSPDGRFVVVGGYGDIWLVPVQDDDQARPFLDSDFYEDGASISPDGNWLAYHSDESGQPEVYVQSFPELGGKKRVSSNGGQWPKWSAGGDKLFYRSGNRMMEIDVATGTGLELSRPRVLFTGKYSYGGLRHTNYDVSNDERFVMIRLDLPAPTTRVQLVTNWAEELKRMVPTQ